MGLGRCHCIIVLRQSSAFWSNFYSFSCFCPHLTDANSLIPDVESWPYFICVVTGGLARAQQPLQFGHGQGRRDALAVLSVRRPGAAPGPREPGHKRHLPCNQTLMNIIEQNRRKL